MVINHVIIFIGILSTTVSTNTFQALFPEQNKLYSYTIKANVSTGTMASSHDGSYWTLEGTLLVQVYDDFGRVRFSLDDLKTFVHGGHGSSSFQSTEATNHLKKPWEVGICFSSIYVTSEPIWVTNMKRAISFNFLLTPRGSSASTSSSEEPCLYGNCVVIYFRLGNKTRKYNSLVDFKRSHNSSYEQSCLPSRSSERYRPNYTENPSYIMTAERLYELEDKRGLKSLELTSEFQYRTRDHILSVSTQVSLHYESEKTVKSIQKLNLNETGIQYVRPVHSSPSNGIFNPSQIDLKKKTYDKLLKIAKIGIDADNIVRNASLIHSLDFIDLLTTMSQLNYTSLEKLFEDVLGTSYELETSRNILLEVLPYVRTDACARLIRHLVVDQKAKIEDTMLISLIRKLPFNVVEYSKNLLEELEVFTKLGPEFPQEIRHAGILSFAALVYKTMEASFDQEYFDDIYDKYLRMYNNCPQYLDRLVWLQGLTNIGKSVVNYLDEVHSDNTKDRHERLWAGVASLNIWEGSRTLENILPILMNETEHIQLRVVALHAFLSSPLGSRDFINVHNYIRNCDNDQLKRFWYTTVKSLKANRFFNKYKSASYYIPFVVNQVSNPAPQYWATNNYIVSQEPYVISQEPTLDVQGPTFQLITVCGSWSGPPEMVMVEFSSGGEQSFNGAIYIIAEGVTSNVFRRLQNLNTTERHTEQLLKKLKEMKVEIVEPEKIHIDIIIKIQDKTVYATHIDQTRFASWNIEDLKKTIEDFIRFGSHINQQMVYYPIQIVNDYPTELGTPIRFHSTIVSFTSIRGNVTAPSTDDLTWRNDMHIRYQGTTVTSLSTDGPLQPSEHIVRTQQSMVIHLPIKLDITFSPISRSLELKWTNPAQNGGIAIHSRTQIAVESKKGREIHSVSTNHGHENDLEGIYFDCEHPLSGAEISQLLTSRSYNFLKSLQPSHFILNSIRLITASTTGTCGLILPPRQLQTGNKVKLVLRLEDFVWDDDTRSQDGVKLKVSYSLSYFRESEESNVTDNFLTLEGYSQFESDGRNGEMRMQLNGFQHYVDDPAWKNWTLCLQEQHKTLNTSVNIDYTMVPASYEGSVGFNFSSSDDFTCFSSEPSSELLIGFQSTPTSDFGDLHRHWRFNIGGKNWPRLNLADSSIIGKLNIVALIDNINEESVVELKEDGITFVTINGKDMECNSDSMDWIPDSWTTLQTMKRSGFYHECRIQGSTVRTFSGSVSQLPPHYTQILLAGECTETPGFAVVLTNDRSGVTFYTPGDSHRAGDVTPRAVPHTGKPGRVNDLRVITEGDSQLMRSKSTGVRVYHDMQDTVVLVPQAYMSTTCGLCAGQTYYKKQLFS